MAYKNLTADEMTAVSDAWVDPANPACIALGKEASLAGLLEQVGRRHDELVAVLVPADDARSKAAMAQAAQLDTDHDNLASGIYGVLTNLAQLCDDGESFIVLRDRLMPDGLAAVVNTTYRGQSGYASRMRQTMTTEMRAQLMSIPLPDGTLLDKVEAWFDAAIELGQVEERRARIAAEADRVESGQVLKARNEWVRVVNALVALAQLSDLSPQLDDLIFGPLRAAEATADLRAARRVVSARRAHRVSDVAPKAGTVAPETDSAASEARTPDSTTAAAKRSDGTG